MLTVNLTEQNLTNKQEIENSEFSQAKPYKPLVGKLQDLYIALSYGWDAQLLGNHETWKAETDRFGKEHARRILFPSFWHHMARLKHGGKRLARAAGQCPAVVSPAHAGAQTLTARHPVLQAIAARLGEQRCERLFGGFVVEGERIIFMARNKFDADSILKYHHAEVEFSIRECGFASFDVRSALTTLPPEERVAAIQKDMEKAHAINAEVRAKAIPTADECLAVTIKKDGSFHITENVPKR